MNQPPNNCGDYVTYVDHTSSSAVRWVSSSSVEFSLASVIRDRKFVVADPLVGRDQEVESPASVPRKARTSGRY